MKYNYYDARGRLLCSSEAPITFNLELYPIWKYVKCEVLTEEGDYVTSVVKERVKPTEEENEDAKEAETERKVGRKKKDKKKGK